MKRYVNKHKINGTTYSVEYGAIECCYICGRETYSYPRLSDTRKNPTFEVFIDNKFFDDYPNDIDYEGWIYHTCSHECRSIFTITLVNI